MEKMFSLEHGLTVVKSALASQKSASMATGNAAAYAALHAVKYGNASLLNNLYDGSLPSFKAKVIDFIRAINAIEIANQNKLAAPFKANIFGRADGAFFVKSDNMTARDYVLSGIGEDEKSQTFAVEYMAANFWDVEKEKVKKEKTVKPTADFLISRITKVYNDVAKAYSDELATSVLGDLEKVLANVRRTANMPEPVKHEVKPLGLASYIEAKSHEEASLPDGSVKATGKKVKAA